MYSLILIKIPASRGVLMNENVLYGTLAVTAVLALTSGLGERAREEEEEDAGEA